MTTGDGFLARLVRSTDLAPDTPAVEEVDAGGRVVTYAQLLELTERLRQALIDVGVGAGELVALLLPSGPEQIAGFYALASLGAVAAPLSHRATPFEVEAVLRDVRPVGVVTDSRVHDRLCGCIAGSPGLRFSLVVDRAPLLGRSALEEPSGNPVVSCHATYKGLGYPLGVTHRYHDYTACLDGVIPLFRQDRGGLFLVGLPIYPVYGLTAAVMAPLSIGGSLLMVRRPQRTNMVELVVQRRVTFAFAVPVLFRLLIAQASQWRRPTPLAGVQVLSGGSWLDPALARQVEEILGTEPYQGYGLTEALPIVTNYPGKNLAGALGVPFSDDIQVAVRDHAGRDCPPGQVGELWVAGPTVTDGFLRRPRETAQFLKDGWLRTGDLGHRDADGFLHFDGRAIPITKVNAQMVDLVEVEQVLREHPAVYDVRATTTTVPHLGERVAVSVILRKRASVEPPALRKYVERRLSRHKVPSLMRVYQRNLVAFKSEQ